MQQIDVFPEISLCRIVTGVRKSIEVQQHLIRLLKPGHPANTEKLLLYQAVHYTQLWSIEIFCKDYLK